jgi:hypothetical protein
MEHQCWNIQSIETLKCKIEKPKAYINKISKKVTLPEIFLGLDDCTPYEVYYVLI